MTKSAVPLVLLVLSGCASAPLDGLTPDEVREAHGYRETLPDAGSWRGQPALEFLDQRGCRFGHPVFVDESLFREPTYRTCDGVRREISKPQLRCPDGTLSEFNGKSICLGGGK